MQADVLLLICTQPQCVRVAPHGLLLLSTKFLVFVLHISSVFLYILYDIKMHDNVTWGMSL